MRRLGVPPLLAATLWARGFRDDEALAELDPPLRPSTIPTLDAAAERLATALDRGERILVHGDYDADGITGSAVLMLGLRSLGGRVEAFLPNRLTHGYGVHADLVPEHAARADLFVTVDCGIANLGEVDALLAAGTDVIVTDHHTPGERLPDALVVHPRLAPDGTSIAEGPHDVEPTGSGVAYHLLWRLHRRLGLEDPTALLDVAAIGTVADVAPLLGGNRALVREGLARLEHSAWPGVRAMLAQSRIRGTPTARDVAFALAPRLNAAGRLGEPDRGLALLTAGSERSARELAVYLDARNDERKRIQDAMFGDALERVDPDTPAIVVGDDDWHPGVMGIVASKLLERFHRPVFIMARGQGSVRSTPGISAVEALRAAGEHLLRFGGHTAAAGFAIAPGQVDGFAAAIHAFVGQHDVPRPTVELDALLDPGQVDEDLWRGIAALEPFGEGHEAPRFALADILQAARAVGKDGRHLQLRVRDVKGVAWNLGDRAAHLSTGRAVQVAAALRENVWNDRRTLEFLADEVRPAVPLTLTTRDPAPWGLDRVHRGRLPSPDAGRQLLDLPEGPDPLTAHEAVAALLADGAPLWVHLDADTQERLWRRARRYPTVHDVRAAWWARSRGVRPRLSPDATELASTILAELGLFGDDGRPLRGERRDPYESPTLVAGLMQRYRIETFLNAYRHLDDDGFATVTVTLFG